MKLISPKIKTVATLILLVSSFLVTAMPLFSITLAQNDTTPPQLIIFDKDFNTPNPEIIVHGRSYDESGTKNVTINGQLVDKYHESEVQYLWQKTVLLNEGVNTIVVKAYDESPNNNEAIETFTITYKSASYLGPTVQIIPVMSQPSNNATVQCIVNPNGFDTYVYLWASYSTFEDAPYNWGRGLETYSGTEEITVNYTFDRPDGLHEGEEVSYIFRVRNSKGTEFTEVSTFLVTEAVEMPDTQPPEITIPNMNEKLNTPNSEVLLNVEVSDPSGVHNVTINGELADGTYTGVYFFGFKKVNLDLGINEIDIVAYDNSPNHHKSQKTVTINYQPSGYSGPTISLVLPTNITKNSAIFKCVINPHGHYSRVYLYYSDTFRDHAPFNHGRSLYFYEGYNDISVQYNFESDQTEREISYMFFVSSGEKYAFTEVMTITIRNGITSFYTSPQTLYTLYPTTFDASTSFSPFGSIESYSWDFGDGNITTTDSPIISHTFENEGNFDVNLTILDSYGLTNSTISNIVVNLDDEAPFTSTNYDGLWRSSGFRISLAADDYESGIAETYYKLNSGAEKTVSTDGEPQIMSDGKNNILEFWSVDKVGNVEKVQTLSGIKLDTTDPIIGVPITTPETDIQAGQDVKVTIDVSDSLSGVDMVNLEYSVDAGISWKDSLMVLNSTSGLWEATIQGQPLWSNVTYKITAQDIAGNTASKGITVKFNYEVIPEFSSNIILVLLSTVALCAATLRTKLKE